MMSDRLYNTKANLRRFRRAYSAEIREHSTWAHYLNYALAGLLGAFVERIL